MAWPSMRRSFGIPLDALGPLLLTTAGGYLLSSSSSGWVVGRLGVGRLLAFSGFATAAGLLGYAVAPAWWLVVVLGLLAGMGAGAIDAGLNAYVALSHSPRLLNWLHACFGLGAALGTTIMTVVLRMTDSWRWGYAIVGLVQAALGTAFLLTARRWRGTGAAAAPPTPRGPDRPVRSAGTLRRPVVWLGVALFFVYTGVETTAGQWSYTLFTESRAARPEAASLWVSLYWGGLAGGRLLAGVAANRVPADRLLRLSMLAVLLGSLAIWSNLSESLSFVGLSLIGLACAPIFPSLISSTPGRLGPEHAVNAIGLQVGAASLGIALLPAVAGLLAARLGLEAIPPFLTLACVVMLALHEAILRRTAGSG